MTDAQRLYVGWLGSHRMNCEDLNKIFGFLKGLYPMRFHFLRPGYINPFNRNRSADERDSHDDVGLELQRLIDKINSPSRVGSDT